MAQFSARLGKRASACVCLCMCVYIYHSYDSHHLVLTLREQCSTTLRQQEILVKKKRTKQSNYLNYLLALVYMFVLVN